MPIAMFLDAAVSLLKRYGKFLPFIPLIGLIAFLWVKLYGFLWIDGALEKLAKRDAQIAAMVKASDKARKAQIALNDATKAKYETSAKDADNAHAKELALANDRTDRFIRANRVRPDSGSRPGQAADPAEGQAAGSGQSASGEAELVAVTSDDVRICTRNTIRLEAVNRWGLDLIAAGVGE